jgi:hypothetical protein
MDTRALVFVSILSYYIISLSPSFICYSVTHNGLAIIMTWEFNPVGSSCKIAKQT